MQHAAKCDEEEVEDEDEEEEDGKEEDVVVEPCMSACKSNGRTSCRHVLV